MIRSAGTRTRRARGIPRVLRRCVGFAEPSVEALMEAMFVPSKLRVRASVSQISSSIRYLLRHLLRSRLVGMNTSGEQSAQQGVEPATPSLFSMAASDPHEELIEYSGLAAQDVQEIDALMEALSRLRAAEKALSEASLRYMEL